MCNIKEINLNKVSKIKSVFTLSVAQKMLSLETLTVADCDELEHIVIDLGDGSGTTGVNIVFPNLKELIIIECKKLKYIFGHINAGDDHQYHHQNHLHIPALKCLKFNKLPRLIGMGTRNYHITLIHLLELHLECYFYVANESIGDFVYSISKSQDTTTIKVLYTPSFHIFLLLVKLLVNHFNLKNIIGIKKTLDYCNLM
jgi:hypothetical protein